MQTVILEVFFGGSGRGGSGLRGKGLKEGGTPDFIRYSHSSGRGKADSHNLILFIP